jgi:hypothetical protein
MQQQLLDVSARLQTTLEAIKDLLNRPNGTRLLAPWRAPWPWWFLGACLAFAGLCLGAGLWQWHTPDAPVLIVGGLVFGLAAAFKAWMQAPAPLRARVRRRWHSTSRV